jgi:hypothetical protein
MRTIIFLLLLLTSVAQASPRYYVFGAAEDDCVIHHAADGKVTSIEGEACFCIQVSPASKKRLWAIDWKGPSCLRQPVEKNKTSDDCSGGGCTQHECLEVVYDTQIGESETVIQEDCLSGSLPML